MESALVLSRDAENRIYAPEGVLNHHHAIQFITFSPPFDNRRPVELNDDGGSSVTGSHESSPSDPIVRNMKETLGLAESPSSRLPLAPQVSSRNDKATARSESRGRRCCVVPVNLQPTRNELLSADSKGEEIRLQRHRRQTGFGRIVSSLNCTKCRGQNDVDVIATQLTLTEEQERKWASFDVSGTIEEDHSLAGRSEISMSAPLLSRSKKTTTLQRPRMEPLLSSSMADF